MKSSHSRVVVESETPKSDARKNKGDHDVSEIGGDDRPG
jgi:hypothetical protein